jgi:hypothetical protein
MSVGGPGGAASLGVNDIDLNRVLWLTYERPHLW